MSSRHETLFNIRYAVRVLERHATLWMRIGRTIKFLSLLGGTSALAALMTSNATLATVAGLFFAALQALEATLNPSDASACARAQRLEYAHLLVREAQLDDAELASAYAAISASDEVQVSLALKEAAYNDVIDEKGLDQSAKYAHLKWQASLSN